MNHQTHFADFAWESATLTVSLYFPFGLFGRYSVIVRFVCFLFRPSSNIFSSAVLRTFLLKWPLQVCFLLSLRRKEHVATFPSDTGMRTF